MSNLWNVEFHCHTVYSKDSLTSLKALLASARRKGLDRVVITDHNTLRGALAAVDLAPDLFIAGEEILTTKGELLAFFVREEVPPYLTPQETIARLKAQGAFISVSHPFDRMRHGWDLPDLLELLPQVDALEIFNARCVNPRTNRQAIAFARQYGKPGTSGSDAHTTLELGRARMILPAFADAGELRAVLAQASYQARLSSPLIHLSSTMAKGIKRLPKRS